MRYILLLLIFNSIFASDIDKLYKNNRDIHVKIYNNTFEVIRDDGVILRKPFKNEQYFLDKSNSEIRIEYKIVEKRGGVDIEYIVKNPTSSEQNIPDFIVDGLTFANTYRNGSINILNTLNFQYMHKRKFSEKVFLDFNGFDVNGDNHVYPEVYSPVIVANDFDYSAGSSLNFNYQKDFLQPHMRVFRGDNGLWRYCYADIENRKLAPKEELRLTLSIRFAKAKNWLYTLYPYKKHFNSLYAKDRNIVPKDLRPISGILLSYGSAAYENYVECQKNEIMCEDSEDSIQKYNLYGYNYYIRPDLYGLDGANEDHNNKKFVTTYINKLKKSGFKRAMIWTVTGQYWKCPKAKQAMNDGYFECTTNYPPQFITPPSKKVANSLNSLKKFSQNGINLSLWWGRSGQVPTPYKWNPDDVVSFDINNKKDFKFYKNELKKASSLGVKEIGLDAFSNMDRRYQLTWLKVIRKAYPHIKFYNEGSVCDFIHTQTSAFIQPQNPWVSHGFGPIKERALLMDYLNPNAEVIAYYPESTPTISYLQKIINLGYTPLLLTHPNIYDEDVININSLHY